MFLAGTIEENETLSNEVGLDLRRCVTSVCYGGTEGQEDDGRMLVNIAR